MEGLLPPLASLALLLMAPCSSSTMLSGSTLISLPSLGLLVTCTADAPAQAEHGLITPRQPALDASMRALVMHPKALLHVYKVLHAIAQLLHGPFLS